MKITLLTVAAILNDIIELHCLDLTLSGPLVRANLHYFREAEHNAFKTGNPALYRNTAYMAWIEENHEGMMHK